jgi:hypothetical protein
VVLLGSFRGPHTLNVQVAYDFSPVYTQSCSIPILNNTQNTWGEDGYWGDSTPWGENYQNYQFRIDFAQQLCTSIRINVSDNQTSNYNEGYAISAMTFEIGILPGSYKRIPVTNIYGAS